MMKLMLNWKRQIKSKLRVKFKKRADEKLQTNKNNSGGAKNSQPSTSSSQNILNTSPNDCFLLPKPEILELSEISGNNKMVVDGVFTKDSFSSETTSSEYFENKKSRNHRKSGRVASRKQADLLEIKSKNGYEEKSEKIIVKRMSPADKDVVEVDESSFYQTVSELISPPSSSQPPSAAASFNCSTASGDSGSLSQPVLDSSKDTTTFDGVVKDTRIASPPDLSSDVIKNFSCFGFGFCGNKPKVHFTSKETCSSESDDKLTVSKDASGSKETEKMSNDELMRLLEDAKNVKNRLYHAKMKNKFLESSKYRKHKSNKDKFKSSVTRSKHRRRANSIGDVHSRKVTNNDVVDEDELSHPEKGRKHRRQRSASLPNEKDYDDNYEEKNIQADLCPRKSNLKRNDPTKSEIPKRVSWASNVKPGAEVKVALNEWQKYIFILGNLLLFISSRIESWFLYALELLALFFYSWLAQPILVWLIAKNFEQLGISHVMATSSSDNDLRGIEIFEKLYNRMKSDVNSDDTILVESIEEERDTKSEDNSIATPPEDRELIVASQKASKNSGRRIASRRDGSIVSRKNESIVSRRDGYIASRRDGSIVSQRDGSIASRRDGSIASRVDGSIASRRDESIVSRRDGSIAIRRDGNIASRRDEIIVSRRDGSIASRRDGSIVSRRDGSIANQKDGSIASQRNGSIASRRDGNIASRRDGSIVSRRDGSIVSRRDGSIVSRRDGSIVSRRDGSIVSRRDGSIANRRDGSIASRREESIASRKRSTGNKIADQKGNSENLASRIFSIIVGKTDSVARSTEILDKIRISAIDSMIRDQWFHYSARLRINSTDFLNKYLNRRAELIQSTRKFGVLLRHYKFKYCTMFFSHVTEAFSMLLNSASVISEIIQITLDIILSIRNVIITSLTCFTAFLAFCNTFYRTLRSVYLTITAVSKIIQTSVIYFQGVTTEFLKMVRVLHKIEPSRTKIFGGAVHQLHKR